MNEHYKLLIRAWVQAHGLTSEDHQALVAPHILRHETAIDCVIRMAGLPPVDWSGTEGNFPAKQALLAKLVQQEHQDG